MIPLRTREKVNILADEAHALASVDNCLRFKEAVSELRKAGKECFALRLSKLVNESILASERLYDLLGDLGPHPDDIPPTRPPKG